jgi:hypothetical protein
MTVAIRVLNGTLGGALVIGRGAEERKVAIFADAAVDDVAMLGGDRCIAVSRKRTTALLDLKSGEVIKRGHLPIKADYICVSPDGARALAYSCHPGLLAVLDPASLEVKARFNLARLRGDGRFDLVQKDQEELKAEETPWDAIPTSDGTLADEVKADDFWIRYASDRPSGLRRLRFTRGARAVFREDGKVVLPFTFRKNGPEWVTDRSYDKPITASAGRMSVGVAVADLEGAWIEFQVLRETTEPGVETRFPVRAIGPDGSSAILQAVDPVASAAAPSSGGFGGSLRKVFGRRSSDNRAFGLEIWDIAAEPRPVRSLAFRPITSEALLPTDTQRFQEVQLNEARKEIDLVWPGIAAAYGGDQEGWGQSAQKRLEDSYFDPLETRKAPSFIPAFGRVHYPSLFAETLQKLVTLHPRPFSALPWGNLDDRQARLVAAILTGWGAHSSHAAHSIAWTGPRTFVCLSRDGMVREMSLDGDLYPAFQLVHPETRAWPYSDRDIFQPQLHWIAGRIFAVDLFNERLEFELPAAGPGADQEPTARIPLPYRIIKDRDGHALEVKEVDRLTERIRRGYVKIGSKEPVHIIAGLHELAQEVRNHLDEIVVDHRWLPSLFLRGKPIGENEFCDILIADGSEAAVNALQDLLTAFLDATEPKHENIWHPNDGTPTMGPVALALIALSDRVPDAVARFYARRDMNHDMWTFEAFARLDLAEDRFLSPDLEKLQIRLAVQDVCTGNVDADIFQLYRLPLSRARLHRNPSIAETLAETIFDQISAQAPDLTWASNVGASGVADAIAKSVDRTNPAEARLSERLSELAAA